MDANGIAPVVVSSDAMAKHEERLLSLARRYGETVVAGGGPALRALMLPACRCESPHGDVGGAEEVCAKWQVWLDGCVGALSVASVALRDVDGGVDVVFTGQGVELRDSLWFDAQDRLTRIRRGGGAGEILAALCADRREAVLSGDCEVLCAAVEARLAAAAEAAADPSGGGARLLPQLTQLVALVRGREAAMVEFERASRAQLTLARDREGAAGCRLLARMRRVHGQVDALHRESAELAEAEAAEIAAAADDWSVRLQASARAGDESAVAAGCSEGVLRLRQLADAALARAARLRGLTAERLAAGANETEGGAVPLPSTGACPSCPVVPNVEQAEWAAAARAERDRAESAASAARREAAAAEARAREAERTLATRDAELRKTEQERDELRAEVEGLRFARGRAVDP
eukprot:TRINITY_DN3288_c3_g1_i1.p2 TRINITY_DN3288_c3_g1~~TRINITY_DN3288_c3_g1_i1.p2  ORF type:complete len:432 (+),score=149.49 TRINITY_DN3288_c3_g1_i1:78-1298(+)